MICVQNPQDAVQAGRSGITTGMAVALLLAGVSLAAQAQQTTADQPSRGPKADKATSNPAAPPADAMPIGDPKSGVLKPPNIDPKMSKAVPDVDPAIDNPPPGKAPAPDASIQPKMQPK
jgi:hypothetical protein